ncbi:TetR/AcrR family transcriptional regulator [Actinoplanes hulinensis]|uniref:TetR/AcrR family transcriptional regulator n=1 Tax=Actinoplanes hulinensis TaxID=1144547 RepID=A0ABS7BBH9_9ACTN|nr:TetR/AcrR family transcriptional regulator C-terminal domain-containing protein [Actinoplanes hulinensis]MBW6438422.1 TetR/AcrR family transcriptional regulator [Actinoplanes hulinensis]
MTEPRRRPGPKRALTEQAVLDAALTLLDTDGPGAASIRRIAAVLGVSPNSVYTYLPDKSAIEQALVERLLGDLNRAAPGGGDWRTDLEALALDLRRRLTAHPGAVPLLLGGAMNGPEALLLGERLLDLLARAGLSAAEAARGAYLIMVYVLGAIALEVADVPRAGALAPEEDRIAARRAAMSQVPAAMFPRTAAAVDVTATWIGTDQYLWGLHRVLDGLPTHA